MTNNQPPVNTAASEPSDTAALEEYMAAYRPTSLPETLWLELAPDAIRLVRTAGTQTRSRVEKDLQTLAAVAAFLHGRGQPRTLAQALEDSTLLGYDQQLKRDGASDKTRENRRGILRRLQAAHNEVPWRQPRRPDGQRLASQPGRESVATVDRLAAVASSTDDPRARCLLDAISAARRTRLGEDSPAPDANEWRAARSFASDHGVHLTQRLLQTAATHKILDSGQPIAVLTLAHSLSRRDLDLGLSHVRDLPTRPTPESLQALRGQ